jgi:hypothetical protein
MLGGWFALSRSTAPTPQHSAQRIQLIVPQSRVGTPIRTATTGRSSKPSPCLTNTHQQLILVSIKHQHLWACAGHQTKLSTPVTTGATSRPGDATPRGTFAVQGIEQRITLTTDGPKSYRVRYWIPFHLGIWGFHDASWQTIPFGSQRFRSKGSHGCVHMPLAAIRTLFHWVHYGAVVRIR